MLSLTALNECFQKAIRLHYGLVAVRVRVGLTDEEVIINTRENAQGKLDYYNNVYNENLVHKFSGEKEIRITGFTFGNTYQEIEHHMAIYDELGFQNQ